MNDALDALRGVEIRRSEPLAAYTGYRTGGPARALLIPETRESFIGCVRALRAASEPFYILGNGSNVLAPDEGYAGCVVLTSRALDSISFDGLTATAGAGAPLIKLCRECAGRGLSGLEFAYGIPGTVGGAVYMNAGAYDGEMSRVVSRAEVLGPDGSITEIPADDLGFGYRTSAVQRGGGIVLSARLELASAPKAGIESRMEELMRRRRDKQPLEYPSCGSAFKRPPGEFAGRLIDECGLRGFAVGGARVSEKHCGFVINAGGATSGDILALIAEVQRRVRERTGRELEREIRILK